MIRIILIGGVIAFLYFSAGNILGQVQHELYQMFSWMFPI